jgi:hypothetical protein
MVWNATPEIAYHLEQRRSHREFDADRKSRIVTLGRSRVRPRKGAGKALVAAISATIVLLIVPSRPSAASSTTGAQLTGAFSIVARATAPKSIGGTVYRVDWSFTPDCDSGACAVEVDTLASSCVSGSCPQPPSQFSFAGDHLALVHGRYQGTFLVKTGCTSNGTYWPYAYEQHTKLSLSPTAAATIGSIGSTPLRNVSAISGTLTVKEASTGTRGCGTYTETFNVRGKVQQ